MSVEENCHSPLHSCSWVLCFPEENLGHSEQDIVYDKDIFNKIELNFCGT
jgi:hypothetical protein